MKAILMEQAGAAELLRYAEVPQPEISDPHELLIEIKAAGLNPVDTKLRSNGTYYPDKMPTILGCDGSGRVLKVGSAVTRFKPGDDLYYFYGGIGGDEQGNYAEFNVINEAYVAHKPTNLSYIEAAGAPLVLITAWEALHHRAKMESGHTVMIHAGSGGVGHIAIQLAKIAGCRVITTVSSEQKAKLVRELGADEVIRYDQENFAQRALALTAGMGVDLLLDTVGGATFEASFVALKPYGHLVTLLQPASTVEWKVARLKNLTISLELMLSPPLYSWKDARQQQTRILEQCRNLFESGQLKVVVTQQLPLDSAAAAHSLIEQGSMDGKVVLLP